MRQALFEAAVALTTPDRAPTQLEMAIHAQVGFRAARFAIQNMVRGGALSIVRMREVDYRNRPVAEYSPRKWVQQGVGASCTLRDVFASWPVAIV